MKGKKLGIDFDLLLALDSALLKVSGDRTRCIIAGPAKGWCPFHTKETSTTVFAEARVIR